MTDGYYKCCTHCLCGEPDSMYSERDGHDDTCIDGCNDEEEAAELAQNEADNV